MSAAPESLDVIRWRLDAQERSVRSLGDWRIATDKELTTVHGKLDHLIEQGDALSERLAQQNARITTAILTFSGGVVTFALSILAATGRL